MKKRTIKSLMSNKKVVYVKLSTAAVAEVFFALARYEGFTIPKNVEKEDLNASRFVRLNRDMSISYPSFHSWSGAMKFHYATVENGQKVVKIDFEKLLQ